MKRHEETIRLIDEQLMLHRASLRENADGIVDHADLRKRIEELEKTKMRLVLDQSNTGSDEAAPEASNLPEKGRTE